MHLEPECQISQCLVLPKLVTFQVSKSTTSNWLVLACSQPRTPQDCIQTTLPGVLGHLSANRVWLTDSWLRVRLYENQRPGIMTDKFGWLSVRSRLTELPILVNRYLFFEIFNTLGIRTEFHVGEPTDGRISRKIEFWNSISGGFLSNPYPPFQPQSTRKKGSLHAHQKHHPPTILYKTKHLLTSLIKTYVNAEIMLWTKIKEQKYMNHGIIKEQDMHDI